MAPVLTELEQERLRRIEENKRRMAEIGLTQAVHDVAASQAARQAVAAAPRPRRTAQYVEVKEEDLRRSGRSKQTVNYNEHAFFKEAEKTLQANRTRIVRVKKEGGGCGSTGAVGVRARGWTDAYGMAGHAAQDRCLVAAEECVAGLTNPAHIKIMTASMVSGGFWCSAPKPLVTDVNADQKCVFTAYLPEGQAIPEGATRLNAAGDGWDIVWLPHGKSSFGFSGNWVGFSIDNKLFPGDCLVCEVLPREGRRGCTAFDMVFHVFRAMDFETDGERDARLAATLVVESEQEPEPEAEHAPETQQQSEERAEHARKRKRGESALRLPAAAAAAAAAAAELSEEDWGAEACEGGEEWAAAEQAQAPAGRGTLAGKRRRQTQLTDGAEKRRNRGRPGKGGQQVTEKAAAGAAAAAGRGAKRSKLQARKKIAPSCVELVAAEPEEAPHAAQTPTQPRARAQAPRKRPVRAGAAGAAGAAGRKRRRGSKRELEVAAKVAAEDKEDEKEKEEVAYEVEAILEVRRWPKSRAAKRRPPNAFDVHIKWLGYEETTWEPISMLDQPLGTYALAEGVEQQARELGLVPIAAQPAGQ